MLLGPVALVPTTGNSCCPWWWNNLSKILHLSGVTQWISCSSHSIASGQSASDQVVAACRDLFRRTWNCLCYVVETFSAPYTMSSNAVWILWIFCSCNWWDSVANWSSTLAVADFDIFCSRKVPFIRGNHFSASSSSLRARSEWFRCLTIRQNSHNAHTTPITISMEAVSTEAFRSSLEQSRIGAQFTASVRIIPQISLHFDVPLHNEWNGLGKCWRAGYHGTNVNRLSNWSWTFLAFRYLSRQCNKSWTKHRSNWCNSSGCQRR